MVCAPNKSTCSGCHNESLCHRKVKRIEHEILLSTAPNDAIAPLLHWVHTPVSLRNLRQHLQHLPTFTKKHRDDHLYGATRYLANTLGIIICEQNSSNLIDIPLSPNEKKQLWRTALFHCRCATEDIQYHTFGVRTFCKRCSLLVYNDPPSQAHNLCLGCTINESWEHPPLPCLACRLATIIYRNPFEWRFHKQLELWLWHDESEDTEPSNNKNSTPHQSYPSTAPPSDQEMLRLRQQSIEHSFQEIRHRATPDQSKYIFENLSLLQSYIKTNHTSSKRTHSLHDDTSNSSLTFASSLSLNKRCHVSERLFQDDSTKNSINYPTTASLQHSLSTTNASLRPPLAPLDTNIPLTPTPPTTKNTSIRHLYRAARTQMKKDQRAKRKSACSNTQSG